MFRADSFGKVLRHRSCNNAHQVHDDESIEPLIIGLQANAPWMLTCLDVDLAASDYYDGDAVSLRNHVEDNDSPRRGINPCKLLAHSGEAVVKAGCCLYRKTRIPRSRDSIRGV